MSRNRPCLILSTVSNRKEAKRIANAIVEARLAACVNIIPRLVSVFKWKGKTECAKELLLVIKTDERCFEKLKQKILSLHSYQVPEIIAWPITRGHKPYLNWMAEQCGLKSSAVRA